MSHYMVIKGIKGNVTAKGYEGAIAVYGTTQLGSRPVYQQVGTPNQEMGTLHLEQLQINKSTDQASALLWQYFMSGKQIPQLEIVRCNVNHQQPEWRSKTTLHNVIITNMHEEASDHGAGEVIELAFSKMEKSFRSKDASGRYQTPCHTSFDLSTAVTE